MKNLIRRFRLTIGAKIVGLTAVLLIGSTISLVWLSTKIFIASDTALIQQANAEAAANLATQMRELFQNTTEKMRVIGLILVETPKSPALPQPPLATISPMPQVAQPLVIDLNQKIMSEYLAKDRDLLAVFFESVDAAGQVSTTIQAISPSISQINDPTGTNLMNTIKNDPDFSLTAATQGEVQISSLRLQNDESAVSIALPFVQDPTNPKHFTGILVGLIHQNRFIRAFSESSIITSFMVDRHGKVIAHADSEIVNKRENFSYLPIVKQLLNENFNNSQTSYVDPKTNEGKLGAFHIVGFGNLAVVAEVNAEKAFEAANKIKYRSALIGWIVLCISFLAGYLYSNTITWPIRLLSEAAKKIAAGNFNINLKPRGRDEIAELSSSFNEMAKGLEERDRVKATFNKFHNKEIAEKLLSGEVKLGGERKEATVFFSDVRGFTGLSESMQPEQVVEMLNEYMTCMVAVIRSYGGVVDKYVGDAIMALWGVPLTGTDDIYNSLRACIQMRMELEKLNQLRIERNQPVLLIGMGLNYGPLIAGNIGSNEKMEYTVIGDAVNLASRIESMTKEYGTDLLVSRSVYSKVSDRFIFEAVDSSFVKGKTEAVEVFKVQGYVDEQGQPVLISTPYSSYKAEKSDKVLRTNLATTSAIKYAKEPTVTNLNRTPLETLPPEPSIPHASPGHPFPKEPTITNINPGPTKADFKIEVQLIEVTRTTLTAIPKPDSAPNTEDGDGEEKKK